MGKKFTPLVQTGSGAHPACYTMGTGSFPGVNRPGRGVDHPRPCSIEVKEIVELYLYSLSGPSWAVIGWTLPLCMYHIRGSDGSSLRTVQHKTKRKYLRVIFYSILYSLTKEVVHFPHISYHLSFQDLNVGGIGVSTSNHQLATDFFFFFCRTTICFCTSTREQSVYNLSSSY